MPNASLLQYFLYLLTALLSSYYSYEICSQYFSRQVLTIQEFNDVIKPTPSISICISNDLKLQYNSTIVYDDFGERNIKYMNETCIQINATFKDLNNNWVAKLVTRLTTSQPLQFYLTHNTTKFM